jgi:esterase/lipase superfamily enzyme
MRQLFVSVAVFATLLFPVACTSGPANMTIVNPSGSSGVRQQLFVVTNRSPLENERQRFGGGRSSDLSFAEISIWIPLDREPGELSYPDDSIDLGTDFATLAYEDIDNRQQMIGRLNNAFDNLPPGEEKRAFVFTHGYNVAFGNGVYRHAQIKQDLDIGGVAVHFSWPSAGRITQYMYDRDSAQFSEDALEDMLDLVAETDAESILVFAHSMGAALVMDTLRLMHSNQRQTALRKIDAVILASPDIDTDVFKNRLSAFREMPEDFVVFVSKKDRALRLSDRLRGGLPRIGEGEDIPSLQLEGITVIDLSTLTDGSGMTHHSTFASSPILLNMIRSGVISRKTINQADTDETTDSGIGALSDLAASIVYLPARIIGAR